MIDLYTWNTAEGHSVAIMLEALRLPYSVHPVDIRDRKEHPVTFQEISPNCTPALQDPDGPDGKTIALFGSTPILLYLAEKADCFLPENSTARYQSLQWACWAQNNMQPVLDEVHEILDTGCEQLPAGLEHRTRLLWQTLANQLSGQRFICGDDLTIADFALYPAATAITTETIAPRRLPPLADWLEQLDSIGFIRQGVQIP